MDSALDPSMGFRLNSQSFNGTLKVSALNQVTTTFVTLTTVLNIHVAMMNTDSSKSKSRTDYLAFPKFKASKGHIKIHWKTQNCVFFIYVNFSTMCKSWSNANSLKAHFGVKTPQDTKYTKIQNNIIETTPITLFTCTAQKMCNFCFVVCEKTCVSTLKFQCKRASDNKRGLKMLD